MMFGVVRERISWATLAFFAWACLAGAPAWAGRSTFRLYNADQGLTSLGGGCLVQDPGGFVLVCTDNGVFSYDGRRFDYLGPDQGLRRGGYAYDIAVAASGRIAVRFSDEVMVSDRATDDTHSPRSLVFHPVLHPGLTFFDVQRHRLVAWQDGFVMLADGSLEKIVLPYAGQARFEVMSYDPVERTMLAGATSLFSAGNKLWLGFDDGRLCAADPGRVKCYGPADGLTGKPWIDLVAAGDGEGVLARSETSVATLDPASGTWSVAALPDQGGRYLGYTWSLGLFRTPNGGFVTQANHGLAILPPRGAGPQVWRALSVAEGAPSGTIVSAMADTTGELWFQVFGQGLKRWVAYGRWETLQKSDGLSDGIAWRTARAPNGHLWISTDTGVDEVVRQGATLKTLRVFLASSYALATGPRGQIWAGDANDGVGVIDPATGDVVKIATPPVNAILPGFDDNMWIGTRSGLYEIDARPGIPPHASIAASAQTPVSDLTGDNLGGVYYLSSGRLRHHGRDGADAAVVEAWPVAGFEPISLATDHSGRVWVGGGGGLFRLSLSGNRVVSTLSVPPADTRANSIVAVMVDHRGWIWTGMPFGVSVFDGQRWVSVDTDSGLVANDVDQDGLREDSDGSVWITTSNGVSHLLDPGSLFSERSLKAVVTGAVLGTQPVNGFMPYSQDALDVQFGTPSYDAERSVTFRYQLSGVDAKFAEASSGQVHYPSVPPGHHVLTVMAYNPMTHQTSPPASLTVDIAFPWWEQWWAESLFVIGLLGLGYGAIRLRFHTMMARQAELKRHVAQATELLRYDGLTGLLNRREIEKHLAEKLSGGVAGSDLLVALIDVDHFKQVNDLHGHLGGDDVLRALGRLILADIWAGECAGRYGGEEILLVLDDSDGRGAERVLQLLHTIRGTPFNAGGRSIRVTCSIGLAWVTQGDGWESLIGRADEALYEAKSAGRDQVVERGRHGGSAPSWAGVEEVPRAPTVAQRMKASAR